MADPKELYEAILKGDAKTATAVTEQALADGADPQDLVASYMVKAMDEVGRRFECGESFVPELLISARAMKGALELIRPILASRGAEPIGRVVIGSVKGDLHDIGKNLVGYMLEGAGFEVIDLGVDVAPQAFVEAAREKQASVIGCSALLTTTMPGMRQLVDTVKAEGLDGQVRVLIGGAPVTQQFADDIGADGYSETAVGAVELARKFVG